MKLKKFEEYKIDTEGDDISIEYTKYIISQHCDRKNGESLESVYADVIKGDDLDEDQAYIIKNEMQDYLYNLYEEAKNIRTIVEIDANKYNV